MLYFVFAFAPFCSRRAKDPSLPRGDGISGVRNRSSFAPLSVRALASAPSGGDDESPGHARCASWPGNSRGKSSLDQKDGRRKRAGWGRYSVFGVFTAAAVLYMLVDVALAWVVFLQISGGDAQVVVSACTAIFLHDTRLCWSATSSLCKNFCFFYRG